MVYPRRSHRLPVLLLLAAGLATGAACGGSGSGSNNGVASIKTASDKSADSDGAGNDKKGETNPEDAMLAFARCMREHGIDMPDPDTSGGGAGVVTFSAAAPAGGKLDGDTNKFQEADKACRDLLGDAGPMNMSPEQQQEMQDQALAFSRCMRDHGVNMPDPSFDGEGHVMMTIGDDNGIDPSDPKFEDAQQACGSTFGPGGGKGGSLSVGGGKIDGGVKGDGPSGAIMFGGAATTAGGGAK